MAEICHRSGQKVYAADRPVKIGGMVFHPQHFTCKATGVKLTLRTATVVEVDGVKEVYIGNSEAKSSMSAYSHGKQPEAKPTETMDVKDSRVAAVPDSNMRTTDRKFNVAGKAAERGCTDADLGSGYGVQAVAVDNQTQVTKPPTTVNNINLMEKAHNGLGGSNVSSGLDRGKYTGATGEAPAE